MKELDYKTYYLLKQQGEIIASKIPKSVYNSNTFQTLLLSGIVEKKKKGKGFIINISNIEKFDSFFNEHFPKQSNNISKSSNIKKYRNSKATSIKNEPIFLLRGFNISMINKKNVDLEYYTQTFGLFSIKNPFIKVQKICFVENLDTFLKAETILGKDYLFLHKYGRIGKDSIKNITAKEYLVFVDYDFNGLDEYLRIKEVYHTAKLFIPENFDELYKKYSKSLIDNKAKMSKRVATSTHSEVVKIRNLVTKNNKFLEQEILTDD